MNNSSFFLSLVIFIIFFVTLDNFAFGDSLQTINISNNQGESNKPQIFSYNKTLYMIWTDKFEGNHEIYYSKTDSEFLNLTKPINLSNNNGSSAFPRIHVKNHTVYATWYDYSSGQSDVFFAKSINIGERFEIQNLSQDIKASYNPWIDVVKNNVYVVWNNGGKSQEIDFFGEKRIVDVLFGDMEIYFARSDNYGKNFEIKNISNTEGDSVNPRLRTNENYIYVVWTQDTEKNSEIYFSKSDDYGLNFTNPINLSNSPNNSFDSGISILENNVYAIWKESNENKTDIYFAKSGNYGNTFDSPINLTSDKGESSITRDTQMKTVNDNIFVAFSAQKDNASDVFLTISRDKGKTFEEPINISNNLGESQLSQILSEKNNLFVLWQDNSTGNFDVLVRQSVDNGRSFGPIKNISNDKTDSLISVLGPQITSVDDHVFVFWENKSKTDDLFLTKLTNEDKNEYVFDTSNQKINAKLEINENDLAVPIDIVFQKFTDDNLEKNVTFEMTIIDTSGNKISTKKVFAHDGKFSGILNFPNKGEYRLIIEPLYANYSKFDNNETSDIIVNVIPEFPSGIAAFAVISIIFIVVGKTFFRFGFDR